ncbi:Putative NAD(P)H nitroreductase YdjA [Marinomonas spartinae]|uniref:Putative NAD(P)H nitroreductase n=1 Tax=Marinomonas spartinae TaxID=1792290 RepID=A0A1A8TME1_9GAMM|nr:nitroreductase [Marinomonas spartinae]SBS34049.1 Putative NAD(P)H nitroreductase YdjA [Marinomonas spartinae]SBS37839.1 Putative NAD(P)H nitroreductase YdjA [Marinomonas spartinae]
MTNNIITFMRNRVSQPGLEAPAPSKAEWETILDAACRAPDHGGIKPWRFRIYEGAGLDKLGQVYWQHAKSEVHDLTEEKEAAFVKKAHRAPAILLVYAHIEQHPKVPAIEQIMATSAAAQQAILGLNALGYGAMWRSGPACFTQKTKDLLNLQETDQIVGLIYVGTPTSTPKIPEETDFASRLEWVTE